MGQKVNPHGFRVGVIKDWDSRWYASNEKVGDLLVEDHKIRVYLKKLLFAAGVSKIEIERSNEVVTVYLHVARPGVVIGKGGVQIEEYRKSVEKLIGKTVKLNIVEVRNPDMDAQLVAENIAAQLEKRISHRRAMKNAMGRAMRAGAKGIKVNCSGRLGGREIAGSEHYHEGTIPLQTIRADIEYGFAEAATTYGRIGVKVWIKIFPDKPITKKALGVRMGSGKGAPETWVAVVKNQKVMFEIGGVSEEVAKEALRLAQHKLPIKTRIIKKEDLDTEIGGE